MSTATAQQTDQQTITLKGSTEICVEFFRYAAYSIFYQREIYPTEEFKFVNKYGMQVVTSTNKKLKDYLDTVMGGIDEWMMRGDISKIVIAVVSLESEETLERWVFNIENEVAIDRENIGTNANTGEQISVKRSEADIRKQIRAIMLQITSCNTFLPALEQKVTFDVLVYTKKDASVPMEWKESDPKMIKNSQDVRIRAFSTKVHKVDGIVSYKINDDGFDSD